MRRIFFPFARSLKALRTRAGLTQPELAEELSKSTGVEITRSAVSMWERGARTPKLYEVLYIAEYFDVSLDAMMANRRAETEGDRFLQEVFDR